jgi:hypothetical protein
LGGSNVPRAQDTVPAVLFGRDEVKDAHVSLNCVSHVGVVALGHGCVSRHLEVAKGPGVPSRDGVREVVDDWLGGSSVDGCRDDEERRKLLVAGPEQSMVGTSKVPSLSNINQIRRLDKAWKT